MNRHIGSPGAILLLESVAAAQACLRGAAPAPAPPVPVEPRAPRPLCPVDPPTAGALRIRPIPHESTASYLERLSTAYRTTTAHLLDGLGIALTHPGNNRGGPGGAELHLDAAAQHRLAAFARTPLDDLRRALPNLAAYRLSPDPRTSTRARTRRVAAAGEPPLPAGTWRRREPGEHPVLACPTCTLRHTRGATSRAHIHPPAHRVLCPLHRHWSLDPDHHLTTTALPELGRAHHEHQYLLRHPRAADATTWATAITTRWYDQQSVLATRWQHRLKRLADSNPHAAPAGKSWALYARGLITYPETIVLARTLATTRLPRRPRHDTNPCPHPAITALCRSTAHRLGIARLTPPPDDLWWTWIHHTTTPTTTHGRWTSR
ncbi:TniQ family protein [Kitasatospora phosalacinea]|uniref:TniQ family protein n=1 Tax=Kitasatospora phosalacinea TaxID=2065 RepID=UPI0036462278